MSVGNQIVAHGAPRGVHHPGFLYVASGSVYPGTVLQVKPGVEPRNGKVFTWKVYNPGTDGAIAGPIAVLDFDRMQGKTMTDGYTDGEPIQIYVPRPGEYLNMLFKNIAGTGDAFTIGQLLIVDDSTGKLIADTGSPAQKPFTCMETIAAITVDTLGLTLFNG